MKAELTTIRNESLSIANSLRLGRNIEVSEKIVSLTQLLGELATSLTPKQLNDLHPILIDLLAAQERSDWLCLADYLEYELIEFLDENSKNND
ncbi:hypothetical protein NO559_01310 [Dasania sp. GY-MA-18]|uniref:Uncharacterized protein n=1 Tax=Dasania phycosphaerae TaxID=2950436 RepID=A0A9J6RHK2_9GAMM|nr:MULTISPECIES: hypothetical protein [Dasania]MCR8921389.1 hypothetical protein [Dasania sp. GY-MA-18]MCZ0863817.1 hypothetical protein [Dasania phycosphaerae]MCZ0867545.1 hypothetical protein [Dasania phycosphaerae]